MVVENAKIGTFTCTGMPSFALLHVHLHINKLTTNNFIFSFFLVKQRVLEFNLRKGVQYYRGSHLFHHWRTPDEKKCGLTFYGPADARAFDRGFGRACTELQLEGKDLCNNLS